MFILLPIRSLIKNCYREPYNDDNKTYEQNQLKFDTDYDKQNPVTKYEGRLRFIEKIDQEFAMEKDEDKKKLLQA